MLHTVTRGLDGMIDKDWHITQATDKAFWIQAENNKISHYGHVPQ